MSELLARIFWNICYLSVVFGTAFELGYSLWYREPLSFSTWITKVGILFGVLMIVFVLLVLFFAFVEIVNG